MSLQVCHYCGWAKVTSNHGLRTHQGMMGCTAKGVRITALTTQLDVKLDACTSIKTDTTDYYSDLDLQICHCGWRKMTTYQGLRTHQGMMGCTATGVRITALTTQLDVKLDACTSIKTDTTDFYSDLDLQICHCGWRKMTTYQGLRIHQGKMGCTVKGKKIPKKEQHGWNNQREAEVDRRKHLPAERVVKKENVAPRRSSSTNCAATAVQDEHMSPSAAARPRRATRSMSGQQQQQFSSLSQVGRAVRERPIPTYPERDKKMMPQMLSQNTDSRAVGYCSTDSSTHYAARPIKEEPKSPFAVSQPSFQRATKSKSGQKLPGVSADVQNPKEPPTLIPAVRSKQKHREGQTFSQHTDNRAKEEYWSVKSSRDDATTAAALKEEPKLPPQPSLQRATKSIHQLQVSSTEVQVREPPKANPVGTENSRKDQTLSQVNRSAREHPKTPPPVLPKKKDTLLFKARQERFKSELQQKLQKTEDKITDITPVETAYEIVSAQSVKDATSGNNQTAPAAEASAKEEPASLNEAAQPDFSTGMKVKELAWMFSATTDQETKNERVKQKPSQVKLLAQRFSVSTARETAVQPKEKDKEEQGVEQVKLLAPEFSASTAREAVVQPQENEGEEPKLSQNVPPGINSATAAAVIEEPKPSLTTTQEDVQPQVTGSVRKQPTSPPPVLPKTKDALLFKVRVDNFKSELQQQRQMKEEKITDIRPAETVYEKVAHTANTNTQVSAKEDPASLDDAAQPDFSSGMKVKELARIFSATTDQEKKNGGVEQKPSQTKLLARRFSAFTTSKTAVQPKQKDKEEEKVAQKKLLAPRLSASTVRETVVQPMENDGEQQKLSQKQLPSSTDAATSMNPAAAEATVERDPKPSCETAQLSELSTGVKVKDLIRMFSATTTQESKEKQREQNLHRW